jgi:hypothetical protein
VEVVEVVLVVHRRRFLGDEDERGSSCAEGIVKGGGDIECENDGGVSSCGGCNAIGFADVSDEGGTIASHRQ